MAADSQHTADAPRHMLGYARVSTADQCLDSQVEALAAFGVAPPDIYTDKATGKNLDRPGWQALKMDLRKGDLLVVREVSRLGRDISDLFAVLRWLMDMGADLVVQTMQLDTRTPTGRLVFGMIGLVGQFEREMIVERTNLGLATARAKGKFGGRVPVLVDDTRAKVVEMLRDGVPIVRISKETGVSKSAIYVHRDALLAEGAA